jgi:hypothetical protein
VSARKFVLLLACINLPALAIIVALNYWIDASSSHHLPDDASFWPRTTRQAAPSKLYYLSEKRPDVVFFGSSRVEVGLPPDVPLFGNQSVYNAGLSASSFGDISALALHYLETGPPRAIVIGLDYPSFKMARGLSGLDYSLLSSTSAEYFVKRFLFDLREALSFDVSRKSLKSVEARLEGARFDRGVTPKSRGGQLTEATMEELTSERGKAAEAFKKKVELAFGPPPSTAETTKAFEALERLVTLACRNGVVTRIFVNPQHSLAEHSIYQHGAWSALERWKVDLASIASKFQSGCDLRIVDFSGYNSITAESIAGLAPTAGLKNYWEASHFKRAVGAMILARLFSRDTHDLPSDFGRELRLDTVSLVNREIRSEQERYMFERANEIAVAGTWVATKGKP